MLSMNYIAATLIALASIFIGVLLAYRAKEELKPGRRYFLLAKRALILIITIVAIIQLWQEFSKLELTVIIVFYALVFLTRKLEYYLTPIFLGAINFFSWDTQQFFLITISLIFIYGLVIGTLYTADMLKERVLAVIKRCAPPYTLFVLTSLLMSFFLD